MARELTPAELYQARRLFTEVGEPTLRLIERVIAATPAWKLRMLRQLVALRQRVANEVERLDQLGIADSD